MARDGVAYQSLEAQKPCYVALRAALDVMQYVLWSESKCYDVRHHPRAKSEPDAEMYTKKRRCLKGF